MATDYPPSECTWYDTVQHDTIYNTTLSGHRSQYSYWRVENQSGLTHKCWVSPPNMGILSKCVSGAAEIFKISNFSLVFIGYVLHYCANHAISSTWFWVKPVWFWALQILIDIHEQELPDFRPRPFHIWYCIRSISVCHASQSITIL